tara:strand:+ start:2530 stop:2709 length:180 start_codon:yes stop_codon:yes gene_type:complete
MLIKYKGKDLEVPDDFIIMCGQHAEKRGITLEEYIAEAFTMLEAQAHAECGTDECCNEC